MGGHSGAVPPQITACAPPNESCAPPTEDCAPKKLIGTELPECKTRPETRKIVLIASEFAENRTIFGAKTRICGNFWTEDLFFFLFFTSELTKTKICKIFELKNFFFWTSPYSFDPHSRIHINKVFMPPKISLCPPNHAILAPGLGRPHNFTKFELSTTFHFRDITVYIFLLKGFFPSKILSGLPIKNKN